MRRILLGLIAFLALATSRSPAQDKNGGGITPMCVEGCLSGISMIGSTYSPPVTQPADGGPFSYTVLFRNDGSGAATIFVSCTTSSPQLICIAPMDDVQLDGNEVYEATIQYYTLAPGSYSITTNAVSGQDTEHHITVPNLKVAGAPMAAHIVPLDSAVLRSSDTLRAELSHPSGIVAGSIVLKIDGVTRTTTKTSTGPTSLSVTIPNLTLTSGAHTWETYSCAVNGRCESTWTTFLSQGPPTVFALDDSLPPGAPGEGSIFGLLPGGLPLPSLDLRGCPVEEDDPEIRLTDPGTFFSQPGSASAPGGLIFLAGVQREEFPLSIHANTIDFKASDHKTCGGNYTYLEGADYDWTFWLHGDPDDPLWDSYDFIFGDRLAANAAEPIYEFAMAGDGWRAHGPNAAAYGTDGLLPPVRRWIDHLMAPPLARRTTQHSGNARVSSSTVVTALPSPGAIKPSTYKVTLNGTVIILGGEPVPGFGVVKESLQLYGSSYTLSSASPLLHRYNPQNPNSDNGGWNELVASISDSTGHTSSVRSRFPVVGRGPVQPLALTPLRDFTRQSQADCAAFGAFQCAGVLLTQGIPGYVSRDKERSLHLVYRSASQRTKTIVPIQVNVNRLQAAPDSVHVRVKADGAWVGDSLRYAGISGTVTGPFASNLWEGADEVRVVGAELPAPPTARVAIRQAEVEVRGLYGALGTNAQTLSQEVVSAYLTDTTMTRYGEGWALAEQSQLYFGDSLAGAPAAVWLSGDGSYLVFRKVANVWVSPPGETAKLVALAAPEASANLVISFSDGVRLGFTNAGAQVWASDLLGNKTTYTYSGTRLTRITDPSGGQFKFVYDPAIAGQVAKVYAKGPGQTDSTLMASLSYDVATKRLRRVDLWVSATQSDSTIFGYLGTTAGAFLTTVTDPRSTAQLPIVSTFTYDTTVAYSPVQLQRPAPAGTGAGSYASYRDQWQRAVPRAGKGRNTQPLERMVRLSQVRGTFVSFDGRPTDFTVDRFNGPTWVRQIAPDPIFTFPFPPPPSNGDVVRHIERDSLGRVTKIVSARDSLAIADSVMYTYDGLSRVTTLIRNTAQFPIPAGQATLDTVVFTYDSVTVGTAVSSGGAWCSRLKKVRGVMGVADTTWMTYGTTGAGKCLPNRAIGIAKDTTRFVYLSVAAGTASAGRPDSIVDANGLKQFVTYDATTWNTKTYVKPGGGTTTFYFGPSGRPDSIRDPAAARTRILYDRMGRPTHQKTGTGPFAPTARTIYLPGGLVGESQVYASSDADLAAASGTVQSSRTYFDRLGQVDSLVGPGLRNPTKEARKQSFEQYTFGQPTYVYGGNGSLIGRVFDDQGRVKAQVHFPVEPSHPFGTEPFADGATTSFYMSLAMNIGSQLSAGQAYNFKYDNDGRVVEEAGYDNFLGESALNRSRTYSRVGALVRDVATYAGGIRVRRSYEYNRRGQRTLAADTVDLTGPGTILGERRGRVVYDYNATTGRLDSISTIVDSTGWSLTYARVRFTYDKGGRETLRVLTLDGSTANPIRTETSFDASGRVSFKRDSQVVASKVWYVFKSPAYSAVDDLTGYTATEPGFSGGVAYAFWYSTDGTRRLVKSTRTPSVGATTDTLTYDVFGNRIREHRSSTIYVDPSTCNNPTPRDTLVYGADNRLLTRRKSVPCNDFSTYFHDQAGNRIAQLDTLPASPNRTQKFSYTAANQLFYTLTATEALGTYNANWHWYDASGIRVMTHAQTTNGWTGSFQPDSGLRTYYFYDGSDVALSIVRGSSNTYWVGQRYLTGGLDQQLAGRFAASPTGTRQTLALVADRQGSTVVAVRPGGTQENNATFVVRGPFGTLEGNVTVGTINAQTGYTGASTPNQNGGFTYLRNRWYDPKTGRFLTQDPIGLAGGVNLYAYAGNNPIAYTDPFGLDCKDANGKRIPCPPLVAPIRLARLVGSESTKGSGFVTRTRDDGSTYLHRGSDYEASTGTLVESMYDGVVTRTEYFTDGNAGGTRVWVRSSGAKNERVGYMHMSAVFVKAGDTIEAGDVLGTSGTTGNADPEVSGRRPHLHVRVIRDGVDVDPAVPLEQ